jgi:hypothetical protein
MVPWHVAGILIIVVTVTQRKFASMNEHGLATYYNATVGDRRAVAVKSGSRISDVARHGVELSSIRQKTSSGHKVHF